MDVIKLAPSEIRFSQDSISNSFGDSTYHAGQYIGETLDDIVRDPDTADLIPNISVFNKDDTWFTSDNRRLWVFKRAEELGILSSIDVYVTYEICYSKFTTRSDGRYVRVRGNNPGGHLWQRQMIEKHAREQREYRRVIEKHMEIERQRRVREQQMEMKRQQRELEQMKIRRQWRVRTQIEISRQRREWRQQMEKQRQWKEWEQQTEELRQRSEWEQQTEEPRQRREWEQQTEEPRQRREWEQQTEEPRQGREWEQQTKRQRRQRQMEIERRIENIQNVIYWIIVIVVLLSFLYGATRK